MRSYPIFLFLAVLLFAGSCQSAGPGSKDQSFDFTLPDTTGKMISLSDFRGKYVVIDMWASWCSPCIREMKYVPDIQKKVKSKDVVWMFISFDHRDFYWEDGRKKAPRGVHLLAKGEDKEVIRDLFDVKAIPNYVWINPDGEVDMTGNNMMPSDPAYANVLMRTVKKFKKKRR